MNYDLFVSEESLFSSSSVSAVNIPFAKSNEIISYITDSVLRMPIFRTANGKPIFWGHDLLVSATETQKHVYTCLNEFSYTDAMTLLRVWRDKLAQFLYILYVMEVADFEAKFSDIIKNQHNAETIDALLIREVDKWIVDAITSESSENKETCVGYGVYISGIKQIELQSNPEKRRINKCLKDYFYKIYEYNNELNNCTHLNSYKYSRMNLKKTFSNPRDLNSILNQVSSMVYLYTCQFLALIILINPLLITTSDYIDYLEAGLVPPDGSQYSVPRFIHIYLDEHQSTKKVSLHSYLHNTLNIPIDI